jgi:hypothetical protein
MHVIPRAPPKPSTPRLRADPVERVRYGKYLRLAKLRSARIEAVPLD